MLVKASSGTRCPRPGRPNEYITDDKAVEVPDDVHHLRLVREGSLVLATAEEAEEEKAHMTGEV